MNNNHEPLTIENASKASTVINLANPEWGSKAFNYNEQPLPSGACSTVGKGSNSSVLFEEEYKYWAVVTFKS